MNVLTFSLIFLIQLVFWSILSFTRAGRAISAIWGSFTLIGFITSIWYPNFLEAWKIGFSGNIAAGVDLISGFMTNLTYFAVQLVVPPWAGLFIGASLEGGNNSRRGAAI